MTQLSFFPTEHHVCCPECSWVMPLGPNVPMAWCPCGWSDSYLNVVAFTAPWRACANDAISVGAVDVVAA